MLANQILLSGTSDNKSYIRPQKSPKKKPKNDHSIAIFSIFYRYGITFMVRGESSCPDGLEYVWENGAGGL